MVVCRNYDYMGESKFCCRVFFVHFSVFWLGHCLWTLLLLLLPKKRAITTLVPKGEETDATDVGQIE